LLKSNGARMPVD